MAQQAQLFPACSACAAYAPAYLNAVAVTNGHLPRPLDAGFTWADLSPGDGVGACLMAAANPSGTFYALGDGTKGRELAVANRLDNLRWLSGTPESLADDALLPLDFLVFDGGLMHMNEAQRAAVLPRLSRALKPGGVLLLGYHALPGFAAMMPLRDVLNSLTFSLSAAPLARLHSALAWLESTDTEELGFLADHPGVRRRLAAYTDIPSEVAATELFAPNLVPFHFAQVQGSLAGHGLSFAGNASFFLNMLDLAVPAALRSALRGVKSRREFETLRDVLRNPFYRRDVYVKGAAVTDEAAFWAAHDDLHVALGDVRPTVDFGGQVADFSGFPFDVLIQALAQGGCRVGAVPGLVPEVAHEAVRSALAAGLVLPCLPLQEPQTPCCDVGGAICVPLPLNRALMRRASEFVDQVPLASPVTGGPVMMPVAEAIVLSAVVEIGCLPEDAQSQVCAYLCENGDQRVATPDGMAALRTLVTDGLARLTPGRLRDWVRLGVLSV